MRGLVSFIAPGLVCLAGPAQAQDPNSAESRMVFFDWNSAEINSDGAKQLSEAIDAFRRSGSSHMSVSGHSDRSGSPADNMAISRRRAEAVRSYLADHGVPAGVIAVSAFGASRPLIDTAAGVREPQNRRVDIYLTTEPGR